LLQAYPANGYAVELIPKAGVEERADFSSSSSIGCEPGAAAIVAELTALGVQPFGRNHERWAWGAAAAPPWGVSGA
jgi:hypothetical protein